MEEAVSSSLTGVTKSDRVHAKYPVGNREQAYDRAV